MRTVIERLTVIVEDSYASRRVLKPKEWMKETWGKCVWHLYIYIYEHEAAQKPISENNIGAPQKLCNVHYAIYN